MSVSLASLSHSGDPTVARIALDGNVGLADSWDLNRALKRVLKAPCRTLVVDLRLARDVDGACWARLVSAARRLHQQGGRVVLRDCPSSLLSQLQAYRWDRCFDVPDAEARDLKAGAAGPAVPAAVGGSR